MIIPMIIPMVMAALLPIACGDDGGAEGSATTASTSATDSGTTSAGPSTSATTTTPPTTTVDDSGTTGSSSITGPGTFGSSTTGEVALCNGWNEEGPATPWLELYDSSGEALASGGAFPIVCGGQGSWMFPIFPQMGGWELADPLLTFSQVEVVVEGFPGPFGSFYQEDNYLYDLECGGFDTFDGGFSHDCIAVLPPDDIADLGTLDGAPATIHIELEVDGGDPLVIDLVDMTLFAPPEVVSQECFF